MIEEIFTLLGMLLTVALVLVLAYVCTRYLASRRFGAPKQSGSGGHMFVMDQLILGKEQSILLVCVGTRYFLLASSASELTTLGELTQEEAALWQRAQEEQANATPSFREAFLENLSKRKK